MEPDKKEELKINLLTKECDSVGQSITTIFLASEKILALGFAVIAAGLTYGLKEKIDEILLLLPIAVFGVLFYGIHMFTELMSLGGYKRHLEEKINVTFGENLLLWQLFIAKQRHRTFGKVFLYLIYTFFLGLSIFLSLSTALSRYSKGTFWAGVIIFLFLTVVTLIQVYKMYKAFDRTYEIAKKEARQDMSIGTSPNSGTNGGLKT